MKRLAALALPIALALTACGGDDGGDADGGDAASTEEWCGLSENLDELGSGLDTVDPFDPEAVRVVYGNFRSTVNEALDAAPDEIRDDVATVAEGIERVDDELQAVDYNFLDVDLAFMEDLGDDMDAASDRIQDFNVRECGFEPSDDGATVDPGGTVPAPGTGTIDPGGTVPAPGAGTVRDQVVAQLVASGFDEADAQCIADNLDVTELSDAGQDPSAILEVFETCGIDLDQLTDLAG